MARKDKLYTVNKFNRPAFMPKENTFDLGGGTSNQDGQSQMTGQRTFLGGSNSALNNMMTAPKLSSPSINTNFNMSTASGRAGAIGTSAGLVNNFKSNTTQMLQNQGWSGITNTPSGSGGNSKGINWGSAAEGIASIGINMADSIGKSESNPRGLYDIADPLHHLAGGRESTVGNAFGDMGVATFKAGAQSGNAPMMIAGAVMKGVGSLTNAAFGMKTNKELLKGVNEGITQNNSFVSNASSFDGIQGPTAVVTNTDVYKGGWFTGGKARRKNRELKEAMIAARSFAGRSVNNNIDNLVDDQLNNTLANYSAFGGPIDINDRNMGAIEYGFMSDYLDNGRKKIESKNTMNNLFAGVPSSLFADGGSIHIKPSHRGRLTELKERTGKTEAELYNDGNPAHKKMVVFARNARKFKHADGGPLFAFGGDMATNSSDWSTGLMHIDAGQSHELNPYDGVQIGTDSEEIPNLVEEGEVIWQDYVFSARLEVPQEAQKWLGVKGKNISFADAAKQFEEEIKERPNDPVSKAGFNAQLERLEEEQEFVKRATEYSVGKVYDVDNNEISLLEHNGYEYEKIS